MRGAKRLKPAKDMTDDELLNEFRLAQSMARKRGQHLPLTVTRSDPENPTLHRPTVERDLDMFRREFSQEESKVPQRMAQNSVFNAAKGIGRANSIHGGVKSFLDGIGAIWGIKRMAEQRNLARFREAGAQGMPFQKALELYGAAEGAKAAYKEGEAAARQHRQRNRR